MVAVFFKDDYVLTQREQRVVLVHFIQLNQGNWEETN